MRSSNYLVCKSFMSNWHYKIKLTAVETDGKDSLKAHVHMYICKFCWICLYKYYYFPRPGRYLWICNKHCTAISKIQFLFIYVFTCILKVKNIMAVKFHCGIVYFWYSCFNTDFQITHRQHIDILRIYSTDLSCLWHPAKPALLLS
jgi:hypothetical protein